MWIAGSVGVTTLPALGWQLGRYDGRQRVFLLGLGRCVYRNPKFAHTHDEARQEWLQR